MMPSTKACRVCRSSRHTLLLLFALLFFTGRDASAGRPLFTAPFLSFDTGESPNFVAVGDLNGDSWPDLAVANWRGNTVSVLLGIGDGAFGERTDFTTGTQPWSLAIGDLDGDGRADLAVVHQSSNWVSVLLGNGDGTFGGKTNFGTGSEPRSVAIGDLNADGHPDLAVANWSSNTVSVLLGIGDGSFGAKTDFSTGAGPYSVAIGDLNTDGRPDLAVANGSSSTVSVLSGNGDGTFGAKADFATGSLPYCVAIGNFDPDGKPDLATANYGSSTLSVLPGNGDGSFGARADYPTGTGPFSVAVGDLDGDGVPDLAAPSYFSASISILPGNGDGTFRAKTDVDVELQPRTLAIADLDHDGRTDMVVTNFGASTVSSLLGNGDGTFGVKMGFGDGDFPYSLAVGDVNADDVPDVVLTQPCCTSAWVLRGNGDGTFGVKKSIYVGGTPYDPLIADLNADGKVDIVVVNSSAYIQFSTVSVLLGNGDGTFGARTAFLTGVAPRSLAVGDLDGDGRVDLVTANEFGTVSVLPGNGDGTFGAKTDYETGNGTSSIVIGDFNADGRPDLAAANRLVRSVSVLLGNGDGTFQPRTDFPCGGEPFSIVTDDFNADGRLDLAVGSAFGGLPGFTNTVAVLLGNGDGTFAPRSDYIAGSTPVRLAIADFDADGLVDLVAANSGYYPDYIGTVSVLPGRGDGTFAPRVVCGTGENYTHAIAVGDLDLDGRPDIVALSSYWASVFLNKSVPGCPAVPVSFDFSPNTLNLHAMGHWVTGVLEPAPPATPGDIDVGSILLNGTVPVDAAAPVSIGDANGNGLPDLTVKFDRATVELALEPGDSVMVTVGGTIGGGCFEASDTIRVLRGHVTAPAAGAVLQGVTATEVRWDTPNGVNVQSVAVLFSGDDGMTWNLEAHELPNSGSYLWTAPAAGTDLARMAVVLVETSDPSGYQVSGILGVSGRFAVASALAVGDGVTAFSLQGAIPNPSPGLDVSFSLASGAPATLAVFDIGGRRVAAREVGGFGPGRHVLKLGRLPAGIYVVRLSQAGRTLSARAVVLP